MPLRSEGLLLGLNGSDDELSLSPTCKLAIKRGWRYTNLIGNPYPFTWQWLTV